MSTEWRVSMPPIWCRYRFGDHESLKELVDPLRGAECFARQLVIEHIKDANAVQWFKTNHSRILGILRICRIPPLAISRVRCGVGYTAPFIDQSLRMRLFLASHRASRSVPTSQSCQDGKQARNAPLILLVVAEPVTWHSSYCSLLVRFHS